MAGEIAKLGLSIFACFLIAPLILSASAIAENQCFDLSHGEPQSLVGLLQFVIFPGPPNYEDVQKGDAPEPGFVLRLDRDICLAGDEFADPGYKFREVQLVPKENTFAAMRQLDGASVVVTLSDQMAAETAHHHRPLVAWVSTVERDVELTSEYGTPLTVIRAFYNALSAGNGKIASSFVVPEKTRSGPFSPERISAFYGSLPQPLKLVDIRPFSEDEAEVRYQYRSKSSDCDGRALVRTIVRGGRVFIASIRAVNGC